MRLPLLLPPALAVATAAAAAASDALDMNGWYPCLETGALGDMDAPPTPFECAEVRVPLCWPGVCESDKTIDLFVRRLLAVNREANGERATALWFLQGGPGGSSAAMDGYMEILNTTAGGALDLYTMDHRGTGRSFFLECDAAQAFAASSPEGTEISPSELPACFADLSHQIDGHLEAFSVTSAATDMAYLVEQLHADGDDVFIYGVSYGTFFTERIMHLAPANVRGYILDGILDEANPSFAVSNPDRLHPSKRFAEACEADALCSSYFEKELEQHGSLSAAWLALYDALDSAPAGESACADLLAEAGYDLPSDYLRAAFDGVLMDLAKRTLVPAIFYRLTRCDDTDLPFLRAALDLPESASASASASSWEPSSPSSSSASSEASTPCDSSSSAPSDASARRLEAFDRVEETSPMLHWIIKASEMWTEPSPTWDEQVAIYKSDVFTVDQIGEQTWYCYMTSNYSSPACSFLLDGSSDADFDALDAAGPFTYTPDEYYHTYATIPEGASVLIFNGDLDFATASECGANEYEGLVGDQKMLVTFQYGVHGTGFQPTTPDDESSCGAQIIAQFVLYGGDLGAIDTTCMDSLPDINFNDSSVIEATFPGLTDLYDGEMPAESAAYDETEVLGMRHHRRAKRYGMPHA